MRELSSAEIEHYVAIDRPLDCAGSFKWEALGISLFEFVQSPDPTALEGLPLIALCDLLRQAGICEQLCLAYLFGLSLGILPPHGLNNVVQAGDWMFHRCRLSRIRLLDTCGARGQGC